MALVLVADDDQAVRTSTSRLLQRAGHVLVTAEDARAALTAVDANRFDVIVSDINMPGLSGLDLLRETRKRDLDVPVVLITGDPALESAMAAVELGAFRYLLKPFEATDLVATVDRAARMHLLAKAKRLALEVVGNDEHLLGDRASLEHRFQSALASLWMGFQPIVSLSERRVVAYEALLRTEEPTLLNPAAFLGAAEQLQRVQELGRAVRLAVAQAASRCRDDVELFVNLHPLDLTDEQLVDARSPLSKLAKRVVLEVTERASLEHVKGVQETISRVRALGYRVAVDDLGAGYAGLSTLTSLSPDVVKLDMSLIRGIDADAKRQRVVRSLVGLCAELSMRVVLEGVETAAERDTLRALGGDIMQGWLFARADRSFQEVAAGTFGACLARPSAST